MACRLQAGESNSGYIHDGKAGNPVTAQPTGQDFSVVLNMALKAQRITGELWSSACVGRSEKLSSDVSEGWL